MQDLIRRESKEIYRQLVEEGGHFYVCGDCTMAEHTYQTLKEVLQKESGCTDAEADAKMMTIKVPYKPLFWYLIFGAPLNNMLQKTVGQISFL